MEPFIFGIAAFARSGKDTFAKILKNISKEKYGLDSEIISFANALKKALDPWLIEEFGISAFTQDEHEKKIIRPILVAWGEAKRQINPNYWISKVESDAISK